MLYIEINNNAKDGQGTQYKTALYYLKTCNNSTGNSYRTWFGSFINGSVIDLVYELWSVVIHVNNVDVEINGVLYFVSIHIHCMCSKLLRKREEGENHVNNGIQHSARLCVIFCHLDSSTTLGFITVIIMEIFYGVFYSKAIQLILVCIII